LIAGELISSESLERMVDPAWPMFGDSRMRYGAGAQVSEIVDGPGTMVLHSGGIAGFSSTLAWLPERELFVAVMVNERQIPAEAALWALVRSLSLGEDSP
jgi:CubicO group peptidase (beta-lactamase class C family)